MDEKNDYAALDKMSDEEVVKFKEEARFMAFEPRPRVAALEGAAETPMFVAEGDSWFDYLPGTDIIDCLRRHFRYRIVNFAKAGDTLENMIYGTGINGQFQRVTPTIEAVLNRIGRLKPKVFLFSGGGNDVAGEGFEAFLNHMDSGFPPLKNAYVEHTVNVVFRKYLEDLINRVAKVSPETHIVTHGYGHTVPTGKGVDLLFVTFVGPWLRPALGRKGIFDPIVQRDVVTDLIDAYNEMLSSLDRQHDKFHHVDLRPMLDAHDDWVNELHLRNSAYARVAEKIHERIVPLL